VIVVDDEVGWVFGWVLHDEGHVMDELQHETKDETRPAQQLTERGSWWWRNSDAVALR
jgi:hypothetical protein